MFDATLVVQSAISSFNNAALFSPDFFWIAVLSLPIFAATWLFSRAVNAKFFGDDKTSLRHMALIISGVMFLWLLTHGSYAALRDGVGYIHILVAFALFWASAFLSREVSFLPHPVLWDKMKKSWRRLLGILVPALAIVGIGLTGMPTVVGFGIQAASVILGGLLGRALYKKNRTLGSLSSNLSVLMFVIVTGLVMQPEFFRFGQLGNLTVGHLLFLAMFAILVVANVMLRHVRPGGGMSHAWYRRFLLLAALCLVLIFAVFLMTESVLAFLGLAGGVFLASIFVARHQAKSSRPAMIDFGAKLWIWTLAVFGILIGQPVLVCLAILLWRRGSHEKFWATMKGILL